jgi:hypothetical protein
MVDLLMFAAILLLSPSLVQAHVYSKYGGDFDVNNKFLFLKSQKSYFFLL